MRLMLICYSENLCKSESKRERGMNIYQDLDCVKDKAAIIRPVLFLGPAP